jgi:hypothetical protein
VSDEFTLKFFLAKTKILSPNNLQIHEYEECSLISYHFNISQSYKLYSQNPAFNTVQACFPSFESHHFSSSIANKCRCTIFTTKLVNFEQFPAYHYVLDLLVSIIIPWFRCLLFRNEQMFIVLLIFQNFNLGFFSGR